MRYTITSTNIETGKITSVTVDYYHIAVEYFVEMVRFTTMFTHKLVAHK